MRRHSLIGLAIMLTCIVSLAVASTPAQAVVVDVDGAGQVGIALVPGTSLPAGISTVPSATSCSDPWLTSDLILPPTGLCWQGGGADPSNAAIHGNETFALTWDPVRRDWATTRDYVEQFLRDVANGSGTLTSPYAVTSQYNDGGGRAGSLSPAWLYGGGCIDYGDPGGATCKFNDAIASGAGVKYPGNGCSPTGGSYVGFGQADNDHCLTDAQLQHELRTMIAEMGLISRTQPHYTPLLVLLTPPRVETCLDAAGKVCSANSDSTKVKAQFCSYHSQLQVGSTKFAYVVQPWTAYEPRLGFPPPPDAAQCDDPNLPALSSTPTAKELADDVGSRLVSPLSQGQAAAIVNPWLNGWFGLDGSEINDNGCLPNWKGDIAVVGSSAQNPYFLHPEFNNAGVIETDPNAPACAGGVQLSPTFVVPSPIDQGDVVAFDGSVTVSTLMVPKAGYVWNFGDGKTAVGPSVVHTYAKGGTYAVHLTTTDRGGNVRSLSQTIVVLGPDGKPVSPPVPPTPGLTARLQLMPQGLRAMLRGGLSMRVTSNKAANGIVTLSVPRKAARRAHIRAGRGTAVVIGRGTVSGIKAGTVTLRLRLSRTTAAELRRLGHVTVTIRLRLVAAAGEHVAVDAAARY